MRLKLYSIFYKKKKVNISSTGFVIGPLNQVWYWFLDRSFQTKTFKTVCKKIFLDQLVGATFFTFIFIIMTCLLDGYSINQALKEFVEKFPFIYLVSYFILLN